VYNILYENIKEEFYMAENNNEPNIIEPETVVNNNITPNKINGLTIASMVLGIVSLVLWCFWFISIPCGVLALIFGILGIKKPGKGMAIAGIITGAITIAIWAVVFMFSFFVGFMDGLESGLDSYTYDYYNSYYYY